MRFFWDNPKWRPAPSTEARLTRRSLLGAFLAIPAIIGTGILMPVSVKIILPPPKKIFQPFIMLEGSHDGIRWEPVETYQLMDGIAECPALPNCPDHAFLRYNLGDGPWEGGRTIVPVRSVRVISNPQPSIVHLDGGSNFRVVSV